MTEELDSQFVALQAALAGRYSLERELGRGGMGVVYLAHEVRLDRPVALKVLPPALAADDSLRERFLREARTSAKLSHPNIVPIYAVDEVGDFVFFAMAYVEGDTLGRSVRTRGRLSAADAVRMLREIAWALGYAHARGVIHRDVKPDNILLESGTGRAIVGDFGIARVAQQQGLTGVGQIVGTPEFMSPEQASGGDVDARSDLYSLGVVGYYALTGELPFKARTVPAILAQHLTQPPPPLASVAVEAPRRLARVIDRCLAKDPASRFQSAEALAEALESSQTQPRPIPAALRIWLSGADTLKMAYGVWLGLGVVALGFILAADLYQLMVMTERIPESFAGTWMPLWSWIKIVLTVLGLPLPILAGLRLLQTRRLLAAGYRIGDVRLALKVHVETRREELTYQSRIDPPWATRAFRKLSLGVIAVAFASGLAAILVPGSLPAPNGNALVFLKVFGWSSLVAGPAALVGYLYPGRRLSSRDLWTELRQKFWSSRAGDVIQWVAEIGLKRTTLTGQPTHRPTELAIGMAAQVLFQALPAHIRRGLSELPGVVRRLEADAQRMRQRIEEMTNLEGEAIRDPAKEENHVRREEVQAELRSARETAQLHHTALVTALETLRLDLLRLRGGMQDLKNITADLTAARALGERIDRLLEGSREVEEHLR